MKCKVCGHRANSISAMSAHYRKKHPAKMRRHAGITLAQMDKRHGRKQVMGYCPMCGKPNT